MKKELHLLLLLTTLTQILPAQILTGTITDQFTSETLIGASVVNTADNNGTVTDFDGYYELDLTGATFPVTIEFSYIGYETEKRVISDCSKPYNLFLVAHNEVLDEVVVSVGRFEQKLTEVTVSMQVVKPEVITNAAPTDLSSTLQNLPGVDVVDKQPSIRGGAGWTYGVGSRCLVMMDGQSMLNPMTGEINWNNIPLENVAQVEVIKGASSVLYGSSALNGIINVRTQRPGQTPETKASVYVGIYDNYKKYTYTGTRLPIYIGAEASHSRRAGNFDISASISGFRDEGYRVQSFNRRLRFGGSLTYHQPLEDKEQYMSYGFNMNYIGSEFGDFFVWHSPKDPIHPSPLTNMGRAEHNFNIDPFFNYDNSRNGTSHKVRGRFYVGAGNLTQPTEKKDIVSLGKDIYKGLNTEALTSVYNDFNAQMAAGSTWQDAILATLLSNEYTGTAFTDLVSNVMPLLSGVDDWSTVNWQTIANQGIDFVNKLWPGATVAQANDLVALGMNTIMLDNKETIPEMDYNYNLDYQFAKSWNSNIRLTTGVNWNRVHNVTTITGTHTSDAVAAYIQYDQRIANKLSLSAGARIEYYRIDNNYKAASRWGAPVYPVFRAGLNWEIYKAGFLRASFGEGYRTPTITEMFARKDIGGGVGVYPNHEIKPESGYSAELGYMQLYKFGPVSGSIDVAGFYTQYKDMIEYQFGMFAKEGDEWIYVNSMNDAISMIRSLVEGSSDAMPGIGAQSVNVSNARVYGVEVSTNGKVDIKKDMTLTYMLGYTFTEPEDMDYKKRNEQEAAYTDPMQMKYKSNDSKYLKYRNKHSFKASIDYSYKWFSIGTNLSYRSKLLAVDYFLVDERDKDTQGLMDYVRSFLFGYEDGESLKTYWQANNKDVFTMDVHMAARFKEYVELQFQINNLLNTEYSYRPMALAAPRTFVCRLNVKF